MFIMIILILDKYYFIFFIFQQAYLSPISLFRNIAKILF
nr:MAG TPA: hypothetical protein [Bacteriophage sp.]